MTKLNPWKLTFWKQTIITEDEIKASVILANKYKVKAKNFIITIQKHFSFTGPEAATTGVLWKKVFLKISQLY